LGQERVWVLPVGVSGHKRNSVTSASQKPVSVDLWSGLIKGKGRKNECEY